MIKDGLQILLPLDCYDLGWKHNFQTQYRELGDVTGLLNFCLFDCIGLNLSILKLVSRQHPQGPWNDNKKKTSAKESEEDLENCLCFFLLHLIVRRVTDNSSNWMGFVSLTFRHLKARYVQKDHSSSSKGSHTTFPRGFSLRHLCYLHATEDLKHGLRCS